MLDKINRIQYNVVVCSDNYVFKKAGKNYGK